MKKQAGDISELRISLSKMGRLAETMVGRVVGATKGKALNTVFETVLGEEKLLDAMQLEIDKEAVRILTVYSPVASDLRFVMSVTRICSELERIGDQSKNICGSLELMQNKANTQPLPEIQKMADIVKTMIRDAMDAFVQSDAMKARSTIAIDNMVDALNDQVLDLTLSDDVIRLGIEKPVDVATALSQILLSRSFERIGDQATNICEEVVYMVEGDDIRHPGPQN